MKKFILILILVISFGIISANLIKKGNDFVEKQDTVSYREIPYNYIDKNGNRYKLYMTDSKAIFIFIIGRNGKPYKYYLPEDKQSYIRKYVK